VFALVLAFGAWCVRHDGLTMKAIGWGRLEARRALIGLLVGIAGGLVQTFVAAPLLKGVNPAYDPLILTLTLPQMLALQVLGVAAEDTVFRGYPLVRLPERYSVPVSIAIAAVFYALLNLAQGVFAAFWAFLMGVGFGALFSLTRSLWPVAIAHYLIAITPRLLWLLAAPASP
jgi:membrane protease YdiL (CAAX protease family)